MAGRRKRPDRSRSRRPKARIEPIDDAAELDSEEMLDSDELSDLTSDEELDSGDFTSDELDIVEFEDSDDAAELETEGEAYLNDLGLPIPRRDEGDRRARKIFGRLREACQGCSYRRLCTYAPVALHIQRTLKPTARHAHVKILREGLKAFARIDDRWYVTLLNIMAERERDGHLAGCLLSEAWRNYPDRMADLLDEVKERTAVLLQDSARTDRKGHARRLLPGEGVDPRVLLARQFRGQLVRAASFLEDEELFQTIFDYLEFMPDDNGRLRQHEVVSALTLFITDDISAKEWIDELERRAPDAFRATFACKLFAEDVVAMFFPYRRGNKRSYLFLSRGEDGHEIITSIDKQPINDVLVNLFTVFDDDEKKTWRIFKELCRHINVRAGKYNADLILEGFRDLDPEDLLLLSIYAPALARAVGHFLDLESFDLLIKFLYRLRVESGRRGEEVVPAHKKIFDSREDWTELREIVGDDVIKDFFKLLFRLNASYRKRVYTTNTFIKLGEAAYLLTALSGWNARGLTVELQSGKPLALIAYGLQPRDKLSAVRARKFGRLMEAYENDEELWPAVETGGRYMAKIHGFAHFEELHDAALDDEDLGSRAEPQRPDALLASAEDAYDELDDDPEDALIEDSDIVPPPPPPTRRSGEQAAFRPGRVGKVEGNLLDSDVSGSGLLPRRGVPAQIRPASPARDLIRKPPAPPRKLSRRLEESPVPEDELASALDDELSDELSEDDLPVAKPTKRRKTEPLDSAEVQRQRPSTDRVAKPHRRAEAEADARKDRSRRGTEKPAGRESSRRRETARTSDREESDSERRRSSKSSKRRSKSRSDQPRSERRERKTEVESERRSKTRKSNETSGKSKSSGKSSERAGSSRRESSRKESSSKESGRKDSSRDSSKGSKDTRKESSKTSGRSSSKTSGSRERLRDKAPKKRRRSTGRLQRDRRKS